MARPGGPAWGSISGAMSSEIPPPDARHHPKRPRKGSGFAPAPDLGHIAAPLRPLAIPIATLALDPANARRNPERTLSAVEATYGQRKPVVVRKARRRSPSS